MAENASSNGDINEGFIQIFSTNLELKLRFGEGDESQKVPHVTVFKIFVRQDNDVLESVRFQLSDDKRLNFLYEADYNDEQFNAIKQEQGLEIEFDDFPNVIRQLVTTVTKQDNNELNEGDYKISFKEKNGDDESQDSDQENEDEDETIKRYFIISQKLEFCNVEIFKLVFHACDAGRIGLISQSRYNEISQKLKDIDREYKDIYKRLQRQAPKILSDFKPSAGVENE